MSAASRDYLLIGLGVVLVALGVVLGGGKAALGVLLVTGGLLLLLVELLVLPGFGVAGIGGVLLLIAAVSVMAFSGGIGTRHMGGLILAGAGAVFLARHATRLPAVRRLMLKDSPEWNPALPELGPNAPQLGDVGIVLTPLRPGGKARFGEEIVEVQSQTEYVDSGVRVEVVGHEGWNRQTIVVRPVRQGDRKHTT